MTVSVLPSTWNADASTAVFESYTPEQLTSLKQQFFATKPSANFAVDYLNLCTLLKVVPHPDLAPQHSAQQIQQLYPPSLPVTVVDTSKRLPSGAKKGSNRGSTEEKVVIPAAAAKPPASKPQATAVQTEIVVNQHALDTASYTSLQWLLPVTKSLNLLKLCYCKFSVEQLHSLCTSIQSTTIQRLYLQNISLTSAAPVSDDTTATSVWTQLISQAPSTLQLLSLHGNFLGDDVGVSLVTALQTNKSVAVLNLSCNKLGDETVTALATTLLLNSSLTGIDLMNNEITDAGVLALSQALQPQLLEDKEQIKNLRRDGIKVSTIKKREYRDSNTTLLALNVAFNQLTEAGMQALQAIGPAAMLEPNSENVNTENRTQPPTPSSNKRASAKFNTERIGVYNKLERLVLHAVG